MLYLLCNNLSLESPSKRPCCKSPLDTKLFIMTTTTQPIISTTLSLPPQIDVRDAEPPTLIITLNLTAPAPITILTWHEIFNPRLALKRRNLTLHDVSTEPPTPISLETTKGPRRSGLSRRKNCCDEKYYLTLYPGVVLEIQYPFPVVHRPP